MSKAIPTVEGWHSQHMIFSVDFSLWNFWTDEEKEEARQELQAYLDELEELHRAGRASYAFYDVNGAKGDLLLWILGPSLEFLSGWERKFRKLKIAAVLQQMQSYTSVTEVSTYVKDKMEAQALDDKLYPHVPRDKYICFYMMSKKRDGEDNWYMLDGRTRGMMMKAHGETGKPYLSVLSEYTTGGVGLDDWEWGVTILSNDDIQFKKIVYDMRFEEVSARFALFSEFYVGTVIDNVRLAEIFD